MNVLRLFIVLALIFWTAPAFAQVPMPLLIQQAKQGNALSQYMLGVAFAIGEGVPQDDAKAAYWMERSANQDVAEAQTLMGTYHAKGQGVPKDYSKAALWLKKAADNGDDGGKALLGVLYIEGRGVTRDKQAGCRLLREAMEGEGNHTSMAIKAYGEYCSAVSVDKLQKNIKDDRKTAKAEPKQVKSISDGFRGVPWGVSASEAETYGLIEKYRFNYIKNNENNSLGDSPLRTIIYRFDSKGNAERNFYSVEMVSDFKYGSTLYKECVKLFGSPTIGGEFSSEIEWNLPHVTVKFEKRDARYILASEALVYNQLYRKEGEPEWTPGTKIGSSMPPTVTITKKDKLQKGGGL